MDFVYAGISFGLDNNIFDPITTVLTDSVAVLLPVGIAILGVMIGVSLIPRIVYKFL